MSRSVVPAIESPCAKEWNQMQGDGKCRYCEHCQLHVHNLSAMTAHEQRSLFAKAEGRVCVAYDESVSRPVRLSLWQWWQRLSVPLRAGLAVMTAFIPMLSSCRSVTAPPASDPIVRDLHKSADGSVRLGRVKVEPESSAAKAPAWERDGKNMVVGAMMPPELPWWKKLLHIR
jgi:predicted Fe-S protein YdhL (DUF1289 family)